MQLKKLLSRWMDDTPDQVCQIQGIQNDSRCVRAGDLFLAYPGASSDGRMYIEQAIARGAVALAYDPSSYDLPQHLPIPCVPVVDLAAQLAWIASMFYGYPSHHMSVIGVTGTNGKTTIAYQLTQAYQYLGKKAYYIGTLGYGTVDNLKPLMNTTPDALCVQRILYEAQQEGIQHVLMEVSSHALSQGRVDEVDFQQAIYTNLSHEHLDYHQTMDAYAQAKALLFAKTSLRSVVVNHDDLYTPVMLKNLPHACQVMSYGMHDLSLDQEKNAFSDEDVPVYVPAQAGLHLSNGIDVHLSMDPSLRGDDSRCHLQAIDRHMSMHGSDFHVMYLGHTYAVRIKALGEFNMANSLAVMSSLLATGYPLLDVIEAISHLKAAPGRMEIVSESPCVLVDYAHTPDALKNVLTTLNALKKRQLWVVFGCGGDRDKTKRPLMGRMASQYADHVIITSDNPRTEHPQNILDEIYEGLLKNTSHRTIIDRREAIEYVLKTAHPDDLILIAGKGHENYQIIGHERFAFSDQETVSHFMRDKE